MRQRTNYAINGAPVALSTHERCSECLRQLPARVREFILYDAASSFSEENALMYYYKYGEKKLLERLYEDQRLETFALYGQSHPEAYERFSSTLSKARNNRARRYT
jgi:hypothetical protein